MARETESWITEHLGPDYPWPGNARELEQCVRNVMGRGEYRPPRPAPHGVKEELAGRLPRRFAHRRRDAASYCTLVFAQTGSYEGAARRLGIDRRTVKQKVDPALLEQLTRAGARRPGRVTSLD